MTVEASRVGKRGMILLPSELRLRFGMNEGSYVIAEERAEGILLRPAAVLPPEMYTPQRQAEFLLMNALDEADYAQAVAEVRRMGLDPEQIPHDAPPGV